MSNLNYLIETKNNSVRAFNPEPYRWYQLCTSILAEE